MVVGITASWARMSTWVRGAFAVFFDLPFPLLFPLPPTCLTEDLDLDDEALCGEDFDGEDLNAVLRLQRELRRRRRRAGSAALGSSGVRVGGGGGDFEDMGG